MDADQSNILVDKVLTRPNICAIMVLPNIGKEHAMEHDTKEEVLERVLTKLSRMSDEQVKKLIRLASEQGLELDKKEPRE